MSNEIPKLPEDLEVVRGRYDKIYRSGDDVYGKGRPENFVSKIPELISSGSVLEIGAGEGRNALYLAEHGLDVTAQDLSEVAIEKIQK